MAKCGKETEVYSRVVGYFRPVKNWNRGKREEFKERRAFVEPDRRYLEATWSSGMQATITMVA